MLISPPFLPPHRDGETDAAWILRAMAGGQAPGQGMFPLSAVGAWHGGMHLVAPGIEGQPGQFEPVRAMADGVVVYRRAPSALSTDITHPLNYMSPHATPQWTHDGVVVVQHSTEIGEGNNARVTYFSITQHLSALDEHLPAVGQHIWRKDKIGTAGQIYGAPNRIHFEIVAAPDQITPLCGRTVDKLDTSTSGRTDALFGDVYVKLPSGTQWFTEVLFPDKEHLKRQAVGEAGTSIASTSAEEFYIGLHYERGDCTITAYREDGTVVGSFLEPGQTEYKLYATATSRFPACPSAGYELLRLGRVIGPDALNPVGAAHWRQVPFGPGAGQVGWVNLNAPGLKVFSDADSPHWRGWRLVGDDPAGDVRCDSGIVGKILGTQVTGTTLGDSVMVVAALSNTAVKEQLKRLVCLFPTEWSDDSGQIDERYGWLRSLPDNSKLDEDDYQRLKAFIQKLGFWGKANVPQLPSTHWHFSPREFVAHFRGCGWLSKPEFKQMLPTKIIRQAKVKNPDTQRWESRYYWESVRYNDARDAIVNLQLPFLNKMMRKLGINTAGRIAGLFGNSIQETSWLSTLEEGNGRNLWYGPWFGRGFLQMTHASNYIDYWRWLGRSVPEALRTALIEAKKRAHDSKPQTNEALKDARFSALTAQMINWRDLDFALLTGPDATGSAGWYWASFQMARYADENHVLERIEVNTLTGAGHGATEPHYYYRSAAFWHCSAAVNLGSPTAPLWSGALNGFTDRCCAYAQVLAVAGEALFPAANNGSPLPFPQGVQPRRD